MNWATPCAPAGLTAVGRNELSRQMSVVKKSTGSPSALAEASTMPHRVASAWSVSGPASAQTPLALRQRASAASAIASPLAPVMARMARPMSAALPAKAPML